MPIISSPPGANTTLSNLASVAINTSLISDTDLIDNLGSMNIHWANAYILKIYFGQTNNFISSLSKVYNSLIFSSNGGNFYFKNQDYYSAWIKVGTVDNIIQSGADFIPSSDSLKSLGSSANYWLNTYTDKLFLNSTATIDGATAGHLLFAGDLVPATDDTEWVGQLETPFKSIKGLIIKDTTNGKHYKVTVVSGSITTTALD